MINMTVLGPFASHWVLARVDHEVLGSFGLPLGKCAFPCGTDYSLRHTLILFPNLLDTHEHIYCVYPSGMDFL